MHLRPASLDDAKILFEWRNDVETRQQSRHKEEVSWEDHLAWLTKSLTMAERKLYIAEDKGVPVGTVRSDLHEDGATELSWTIAPSQRGKGFGQLMVIQFVKEIHPGEKLIAVIRKGNSASEKIAKVLGLSQEGPVTLEEPPLMIWRS